MAIGNPKYGCQTEQEWQNIQKIEALLRIRQKCRTDAVYLAHMLGYKDVCPVVHGPILDVLQKFKGGIEGADIEAGKKGVFVPKNYRPAVHLWDLRENQDTLILYPRGHLKSSIATEIHTVQWIINYPDIAIALMSATSDLVEGFLKNIKKFFTENQTFREVFPDFVPDAKGIKDFGNTQQFTVPCRQNNRKEPTLCVMTVGKPMTGFHFDVIKPDDVVYPENCRTKESIQSVNSTMGNLTPLLTTAKDGSGKVGWIEMAGTRYDFSDYYGLIQKAEKNRAELGEPSLWKVICRPAIYEENGERKALWPKGMPLKKLDEIRSKPEVGSANFNAQYLMQPLADGQGLATEEDIKFVPRVELDNHVLPRSNQYITVDLGGLSENARKNIGDSDYTVINHHGWCGGKLYINRIVRGRFTPFEIIDHIFKLLQQYPRTRSVKVEEEAHARVLLPYLKKAAAEREVHVPILGIKRDNQTSKENRIRGLQPFFEADMIRFADDLPKVTRLALIDEVQYFPKFAHDDILDTCADATQERDGKVVYDMVPQQTVIEKPGFIKNPDGTITWFAAPLQSPDLYHQHEYASAVDEVTGW